MDRETISKTELAWLAGIIDGEGCIYGRWRQHNKHRRKCDDGRIQYVLNVGISITNTDVFLIQKISEICEKMGIGFAYTTKPPKPPRKGVLTIIIEGKGRCRKLLEPLLPYFGSKKEQANVLLGIIRYRESLGYVSSGYKRGKNDENGKHIHHKVEGWEFLWDNEKLNKMIRWLSKLKEQQVLPSETKRAANRKLIIPVR